MAPMGKKSCLQMAPFAPDVSRRSGQKYTRSHQAFTNRREHPVGQSFEHRLMLDRYAEYFSNDGKCYWAGQVTYRVELSLAFNVVEQLIGKSLNPWSQEIDAPGPEVGRN
jgi:hypothetical protein